MAVISARCPHCNTEKMAFTFVAQKQLAKPRQKDFLTLFSCNKCQSALVVEYEYVINHGVSSPGHSPGDPGEVGFKVKKWYPGPMPTTVPIYTPSPLDRYFTQASDAQQSGHSDASGAMSRKVIDVSTQQMLGADAKKFSTIQKRIDELANRNLLTPDLKDWAHQVRLDGNDASHDEDPFTDEEASQLLGFAELYLTYVYSLPGRLKARREQVSVDK